MITTIYRETIKLAGTTTPLIQSPEKNRKPKMQEMKQIIPNLKNCLVSVN